MGRILKVVKPDRISESCKRDMCKNCIGCWHDCHETKRCLGSDEYSGNHVGPIKLVNKLYDKQTIWICETCLFSLAVIRNNNTYYLNVPEFEMGAWVEQ